MPAEAHALGAKWLLYLTAMKTVVGTVLLDVHQQGSPTPEPWSYKEPHSRSSDGTTLLQENNLNMPTNSTLCSCLLAASPGPELCPVGLYRSSSWLTMAYLGPYPTSWQLPQAQLHHYNGLFRPSSCLPAFSPGPELSQVNLTRPSSCLSSASQGPAFASQPPSKTQLLFYSGLLRPTFCLLAACTGPAPASGQPIQSQNVHKSAPQGPAPAFHQPLQAQLLPPGGLYRPNTFSWLCLEAQLLPHNNFFWLSSCPAPGGLCRPKTASSQVLQTHLLPPNGLDRPSSCVTMASPGPDLASQRTL
ncbi:putative uncharacterized protein FLJ44672 isoform X2 [Piliocolobus tephrosceles]|uniref:putative uncharacterized protein FLJ44672 isoform X2 n=1 Tax=Piliocolobus tephrosceles TaxID=591936 RepID=UPI000C2A4B6F|nr:putative uncharacterized protein FLJ44672 isoform X2 [Piliocolobus tephrosceles]XP_023053435.1 putative uncharacterized protein FLJ44672 isoform X2 [Piliocolobus tephrosceles]